MTVTIRPIRNEEQLDAALARVDELIDCEPGSAEAEELEVLSLVVEAYEDKTHPIGPPAPIAAINFHMDQRGLTEKDVQELLGTELTVSELLSKERGDDFQLVLTRYAGEPLLYRLTLSEYQGQFVLKGATLFTIWTGEPHRATRDIDLLGFGDPSEDHLRSVFEKVLAVD